MPYTVSHEWVELEGEVATIGITDSAQKELGEIVYVELPKVKAQVRKGDQIAILESTKAAVDLYTPLTGEVVAVNELLVDSPEKLNESPRKEGWIYKILISEASELDDLLEKE